MESFDFRMTFKVYKIHLCDFQTKVALPNERSWSPFSFSIYLRYPRFGKDKKNPSQAFVCNEKNFSPSVSTQETHSLSELLLS